jgi:FkbM family methyltransferase
LKPGDIAVDAGAHIGFFTVQMADVVGPTGRIYAFEPVPANADLLRRSILENRFEDRVEFRCAAVGAATGSATLTYPRETLNTGGAYMLGEGTSALPGHETSTVDVVALDQLCVRRPVGLIKMDVEGAEPLVLRGAATLLTEDRPVVLSELHPTQLARASNTTAAAFLEEARRFGYRAHYLQGGDLGPPIERAPDDVLASFVLVPL